MIIDTHAHILVPEMTLDAAPAETWRPRARWQGGEQVIEFAGRRVTATPREFVDINGVLAAQSAAGVDHTLLCPWVSLINYDADRDEGLRRCRIWNDALSGIAERYPARVSVLGTVPLQDPALAARELEDLMRRPGVRGVEVLPNVGGAYLGDDRFGPFWDAALGTGALVFIHPSQRGFDLPVFKDYFLWNTIGNPMETTIAAAHLILAGVLETRPGLKLLLAHGGGTIMMLRGRLARAHRVNAQAKARLREPFEESLRRCYFDTIVHDRPLLLELIRYAGADHVLLGSDYPFDMGETTLAEPVRALGLDPTDEANVTGGTAARLFGLGHERRAHAREEDTA